MSIENKYGITFAGNITADCVKMIDDFPSKGMHCTIHSESHAVGGLVPNTAINLAKIDAELPIDAVGRVGNDDSGRYVVSEMRRYGIHTDGILISEAESTSYSDVMTIKSTGERTMFHHRGANREFSPADIDVSALRCKMFHVGYILLLDQFDAPDAEYGTAMARFLKSLQDAGIKTSFDVVSEHGASFAEKVMPALKYTDNAIMNEIEGCAVVGIEPRDENGALLIDHVKQAMQAILERGVSERVILHCPEAGFILNRNGSFTHVPSLKLEEGYIQGTVGAGDAFCAGCLYGIYHDFSDRDILRFAAAAAACNLSAVDSVSGMKSKEGIYELLERYEQK